MKITELIKNQNVNFLYYREGEFIYETDNGFKFPVPLDDVGKATLLNKDKAIYFMRYVRKWLEILEKDKSKEII